MLRFHLSLGLRHRVRIHLLRAAGDASSVAFSSFFWSRRRLSRFLLALNRLPSRNPGVCSMCPACAGRHFRLASARCRFFVLGFIVSLHLTGSSAKVAVSYSALDFIISRFVLLCGFCVLVRWFIFLAFKIPSPIVVSIGFFCITWSKGLFCRCGAPLV